MGCKKGAYDQSLPKDVSLKKKIFLYYWEEAMQSKYGVLKLRYQFYRIRKKIRLLDIIFTKLERTIFNPYCCSQVKVLDM